MSTKHTPGPWEVREHWGDDDAFEVYPTRGGKQPPIGEWAALAEVPEYGQAGEAEANAYLIAAAPELLEALDGMLQVYGGGKSFDGLPKHATELELIDQARAAVAKAKGAA